MKVKASKDFQFYRLAVMKVIDEKTNEYSVEMSYEDYRKLQHGESVDIDKRLYEKYRNCFEVEPPKKEVKKEVK